MTGEGEVRVSSHGAELILRERNRRLAMERDSGGTPQVELVPTHRVGALVHAGALIAAEIDRIEAEARVVGDVNAPHKRLPAGAA